MTTGRFVYKDNAKIGALFSNHLATDDYLSAIRQKYVYNDTNFISYTRQYGVYGSTFTGSERKNIYAIVHSKSDFVQQGLDKVRINEENGELYLVRNLVFPGLENTYPAGFLVWTHFHKHVLTFFFLIPVLIIFFGGYVFFTKTRALHRKRVRFLVLMVSFLVSLLISSLFIKLFIDQYQNFKDQKFPLYNSVLRILPEAGVYDSNYEKDVDILVDSGGEAINTFEVHIAYDPDSVEISNVDFTKSLCELVVKKEIDSIRGAVTVICGTPAPGFSGQNGVVATLQIKVKKRGSGFSSI